MSDSLKHLSGETQRIAQDVLVDQALSAPRLRTENEKFRALLRQVLDEDDDQPVQSWLINNIKAALAEKP